MIKKHETLTRYIKHLADSADFKGGTFNKHRNGLIGNRFEMPNVSYTHPLYATIKAPLMTDEELNKWNLRFCPKCRGHIQISFRRNKEGGIEIIRHCQNFNTCDFRSVLTKENITDNDRHKIIETFFGYNKPFFIDKAELKSLTTEKLLFDNVEDFLKWFVFETSRYNTLDYNNLPVSSPYWTIVNKLGQFLSDNYEYELKQIIQNKANIDNEQFLKTNSGLSFNILYA